MSFNKLIEQLKGGAGSGNFGHSGIPGKVGGSAPGGSKIVGTNVTPLKGGQNQLQADFEKATGKKIGSGSAPHKAAVKKLMGQDVTIYVGSSNVPRKGTLIHRGENEFKTLGGFTKYRYTDVKSVVGTTIRMN